MLTSKQKIRWERIKAKGKRRFVLENAFAFGSGVALSETIHKIFWTDSQHLEWKIVGMIALSFVFTAFCSALGALWYWERNEKKEFTHNGTI